MNESQHTVMMVTSFLIASVLTYTFTISMAWLLTPSEYGILAIFLALSYVLSVFVSSAIPPSLAKRLSEDLRRGEIYCERINIAILGNIILGLIISTVIYGAYYVYYSNEVYYPYFIYFLLMYVLISAVLWTFRGALQGTLDFRSLSVVQLVDPTVKLGLGVALVVMGFNLNGALTGIVVSIAVASLWAAKKLSRVTCWSKFTDFFVWRPESSHHRGGRERAHWKILIHEMMVYAPPMFIGLFGITTVLSADLISVKLLYNVEHVHEQIAFYQADQVMGKVTFFLTSVVLNVIFPYVSYHSLSPYKLKSYAHHTLKYIIMLVTPICAVLIVLPTEILSLVYPDIYSQGAHTLMIYAPGIAILSIGFCILRILQGSGHLRLQSCTVIMWVALELVFLYLLVPRYGIDGAATAFTLSTIISTPPLLIYYLKLFPISLKTVAVPASQFIMVIIAMVLMLTVVPHDGRVWTLVDVLLALFVYLILLLKLHILNKDDVTLLTSGFGERASERIYKIISKLG
ncbi:MAG: oligosaccharide flippase family protein [Methermicoccaceae archaeon]